MPEGSEPYVRDDGKTVIQNACGHTFAYTIRRPQAVKWLQSRPCPACARDAKREKREQGQQGQQDGQTPQQKPETPKRPKLGDILEGASDPAPEPAPEPKAPKAPKLPAPDSEAVAEALGKLPELFHRTLPDVIALSGAGLPLWLQGPPGTSKSTLGQQAAEALGLGFFPMPCHEMMTESTLFGYRDALGEDHRTPLRDAYERGGVCLLDEVDNGNPNLLAALNSALSNGHAVFAGTIVERHPDFRVIATANTAGLGPEQGYIGRNGVDLATRDRFVTVDVPIDSVLERALAAQARGNDSALEACASEARQAAEALLRRRSSEAQQAPDSEAIVQAVGKLRDAVASRFRGTVVSPRTTIHASTMVGLGFTLREALASKLPGLAEAEAATVLASAGV